MNRPAEKTSSQGYADELIRHFVAARRAGTPLLAVTTPDPRATIETLRHCISLNEPAVLVSPDEEGGKPKSQTRLVLTWDVAAGMGSRDNKADADAKRWLDQNHTKTPDPTVGNPVALMKLIPHHDAWPPGAVLFVVNFHRFLDNVVVMQAVSNLRDQFKAQGQSLVMLGPDFEMPAELRNDVVVLDQPLPGAQRLGEIITGLHDSVIQKPLGEESLGRCVEAVTGLTAFAAEQVTAMSLTHDGPDVDDLWARKTQQVEATPGLKMERGGPGFDEIGGVPVIKDYLERVMTGRDRPNAVVFLDEVEKMLASGSGATGSGGGGDTSGVSQDQLGTLLSYMQDQRAVGMIFVGPPGSAKSMVAKAAGVAGGVPTLQLDLGAAKGSLVGQSERQLREALKVITHVSNGRTLWIATCNAIASLPPELRRRFTLGTFFFDLPDADERATIWKIHAEAFGFEVEVLDDLPEDRGWTGAEVRQCCEIAWRLGVSLREAATKVVPVARSAAEQIKALRAAAEGKFLSASRPETYSTENANRTANGTPSGLSRVLTV